MARTTIQDLYRWKREGVRFASVTAYDAPTARICHEAGIQLLLVGDSLGNVVLGYPDTRPVRMDDMIHHGKAVRRGAPEAFVIGDLPFLSYQCGPALAVQNAGRFVQECLVDGVKLEGGRAMVSAVEAIVAAGIPVMGHLGLTPQTAGMQGGMRVQGTDALHALEIVTDAHALVAAGVFSIVLECVPQELARIITEEISVPTIGIGAGPHCDGQILVFHDLVGIDTGVRPRFVRRYGAIEDEMKKALQAYAKDVTSGDFPGSRESFHMPEEELQRFGEKRGTSS